MPQNRISVLIVFESGECKKTVPLARVADPNLTSAAATLAIRQAAARAAEVARADHALGVIEQAEARRLRDVLTALLPDIGAEHPQRMM